MDLWIPVLIRHAALDWGKISRYERRHFFRDNFLGIRYYFTRLQGLETRCQCIFFALGNEELHHLDLYLCLSRMTANELNSLLSRLPDRQLFEDRRKEKETFPQARTFRVKWQQLSNNLSNANLDKLLLVPLIMK
ncbi:uncharacterized protein TNIN_271391 [Trichonephila inaurata madagascariensis]|uniref:Uncharacterized protein n=1 Tax=Trichonephila inaurata madagascariensis TaxID=2747483 RepID=A0A8X7CNY0_9ARAC|nr:uncharacterized protein TNIN_271391 [Trichonephila inaurata madagascariensis]